MRYARTSFTVAALITAVTTLAACAGGEKTETPDSAAAAAAAAPPPPESFALAAEDGSWTGDITPGGIVYRPKNRDSLMFDFKAPTVNGAISDYESLMTGKDTIRISISLATTKCTDKAGAEYTHMAQVWLTGRQGGRELNTQTKGCANKK
ncbi:MAG TPA: hypothetical protein VIK50_07795 [Gemmatimonadaceae bacterium]